MNPILLNAVSGFKDSFLLCISSALSFIVANAMPEESLFKMASGITGWALAVSCIWVLSKSVKTLFSKLEEKDALIRSILEKQRDDLQHELDEKK